MISVVMALVHPPKRAAIPPPIVPIAAKTAVFMFVISYSFISNANLLNRYFLPLSSTVCVGTA